jgi:hypothetical protein
MPAEVGSLYETEQELETRSQYGAEKAPVALLLDHPAEPVGERPVTVAVQTAESPAAIEMGLQLTVVVVGMAKTLSEVVPELPRLIESLG